MTNQELKELFEQLERAGMNPQLCDTPVPLYENCVQGGIPIKPFTLSVWLIRSECLSHSLPAFKPFTHGVWLIRSERDEEKK